MSEYAVYQIKPSPASVTVCYSVYADMGRALTEEESAVKKIVSNGFGTTKYRGKAGVTIDPYKAAEAILADHYGCAKMVEAHYEWRPNVRY